VEEFRHLIQDDLGGTITVLQTLRSVRHDEQTAAIGAVQAIEHPVCGRMLTLSPPWKFSEPLTALRRPAPLRGQHSDEILQEHGYALSAIATLRAQRGVGYICKRLYPSVTLVMNLSRASVGAVNAGADQSRPSRARLLQHA
jgi:hypothetical protein